MTSAKEPSAVLRERLNDVDPAARLDAATELFVILWTWVSAQLPQARDAVQSAGEVWHALDEYVLAGHVDTDVGHLIDTLRAGAEPSELLVMACRMLKRLDRGLRSVSSASLHAGEHLGTDGAPYEVRRRNAVLHALAAGLPAEPDQHHPPATGGGRQETMFALAWRLVPVPTVQQAGLILRSQTLNASTSRHLARAADSQVVIMCATLDAGPPRPQPPPPRLRIDRQGEPIRRSAIDGLIATARDAEATILILPELALTTGELAHLTAELSAAWRQSRRPFPALTVAGLCHSPIDPSEPTSEDCNEAVVLDKDGAVILRHRKCIAFSPRVSAGLGYQSVEVIRHGDELTVLDTPIGVLAIPICVDLFQEDVASLLLRSNASLVCVPSLSPKLGPHLGEARDLAARRLATTCCANTWFGAGAGGFHTDAPSFVKIPALRVQTATAPVLIVRVP